MMEFMKCSKCGYKYPRKSPVIIFTCLMKSLKALVWIPFLIVIAIAMTVACLVLGFLECWKKNEWPWEIVGS